MQQIPFFEMFTSLPLSRDVRASLDGAYLTAVEVEKQNRIMRLALTVPAGRGEKKVELAAAVAAAYAVTSVGSSQTVAAPAPAASPLKVRCSPWRGSIPRWAA